MWPFKKKKKLITNKDTIESAMQTLAAKAKAQGSRARAVCTKGKGCICEDCPKLLDCHIEMGIRKGGCDGIIASCSVKSFLLTGKPSDFADTIATVKVRNALKTFEEEYNKLMKAHVLKQKEDANGTKAVPEAATPEGDGPSVLG